MEFNYYDLYCTLIEIKKIWIILRKIKKNYLCKLIEKGLAENSMLANVAASSEAKNLEERKAYSLKVDRIDIKEIMSKVFENTYRNFISITEKSYSAEINIKNKDISNFILGIVK